MLSKNINLIAINETAQRVLSAYLGNRFPRLSQNVDIDPLHSIYTIYIYNLRVLRWNAAGTFASNSIFPGIDRKHPRVYREKVLYEYAENGCEPWTLSSPTVVQVPRRLEAMQTYCPESSMSTSLMLSIARPCLYQKTYLLSFSSNSSSSCSL